MPGVSKPFHFKADTPIAVALELDPRVIEAMKSLGLKCVDKSGEMCVAADVETLTDASRYHDIPLDRILETLNALGVRVKEE